VVISAAVAATLGGARQAGAGNFYWEGDASSIWNAPTDGFFGGNWSSQLALNNDPLALPGSGDDVFFYGLGATPGPVNTTLGKNFSIQSLTFLPTNDQPVSIDGGGVNSLTIGAGGLSVFGGTSPYSISANVILGASQTWGLNGSPLTVSGVISGANSLTTSGPGTLNLSNANTFSGALLLATAGNVVTLGDTGGSALNVSSVTLNGGAILNLDSTSNNHGTQNRLADNVSLNLGGGTFNVMGNGSTATTETVGTLNLKSGASQVSVTAGAGSTLTFGSASIPSVTRAVGGAVNFSPEVGATIRLPNVTPVSGILGGYATIGAVNGNFGDAVDWAAVNGAGQVVPYTAYVNDIATATPTSNVQVVSPTLLTGTGTYTVNSIYVNGAGGGSNSVTWAKTDAPKIVVGAGGILVNGVTGTFLTSGTEPVFTNAAVIGINPVVGTSGNTGNLGPVSGSITAGPDSNYELIVTTANAANLRLATVITNNGTNVVSLTKNGSGILDLGDGNDQGNVTANTFTGKITVNGGTLQVNGDLNLGPVPAAVVPDFITLNGATLRTTRTFAFNTRRGVVVGSQGGTLFYSGGSTWILNQPISGPGGIAFNSLAGNNIQIGPPTTGSANSFVYQGSTTFNERNGGTIHIAANDVFPHNSAFVLNNLGGGNPADFGFITGTNAGTYNITVGSLAGNLNVNNHRGILTIGQNNTSTTYSGVLAGTGSVVKVGIGTQTFSGNNTYSGPTTVTGGTLLINGAASGTGAVNVGVAGTLGGNGQIAGAVTVNGALAPATDLNSPANLTINNNLTINPGAALNYLFGSPGNNDVVTVSGAGHTLLLPAGSDLLNINDLPSFGVGTYTLLQAVNDATLTDNATFVIGGTTLYNYSLTATNGVNGSLVLNVTPGNPTIVWAGSVNNNWNTSTTNWSGNSAWLNGDNAVFDNSGTNTNISVAASGFLPNSMLFNNSSVPYSFSGGPITTAGSLTKNQAGAVTFNNVVTAGLVKINGGSVTVGSTGVLNSTSLTVSTGAALNVAGALGASTALQSDGTTTFTSAAQTLAALNGGPGGVVNLNGPTTLTVAGGAFAGAINGAGGLTINSPTAQNFSLSGLNYTGNTLISSGGLVATGNVAAGNAIQVGAAGGTNPASLLAGGAITINRNVLVADGSTGAHTLGGTTTDTSTFTGTITLANTNGATLFAGPGTVNFTGAVTGAGGVNVTGPGAMVFGAAANTYTGATTVTAGTLQVNGSMVTSGVTVQGGGTFIANGPSSTGSNAVTVNAATISPGNGNTYAVIPGNLNANAVNALAGVTVNLNGGVANLNAGNTTPITAINAANNATVNVTANTPVTLASVNSLKLDNSVLAFSTTTTTPSSVTQSIAISGAPAGTLANLPLSNSVVNARLGAVADLGGFNLVVAPSVYAAGLREGLLLQPTGNINTTSIAPRTGPIQLSPVQANATSNQPDQSTYTYTGQILVQNTNGDGTGSVSFAESFDDAVQVKIDNNLLINDGTYNVTTSGSARLSAGWHNIELRFGQGGGGVGQFTDATNGWGPGQNGLGFGYAANDTAGLAGSNYTFPTETGTSGASAVLFRTVTSGGAALNVDDGGTLIVGSISGEAPALNFGPGTNGANLIFASHTNTIGSALGALSIPTATRAGIEVRAGNLVSFPKVSVTGTLIVTGEVNAPSIEVAGPGTTSAQLTFNPGSRFASPVNVLGAGLVTISATDTANANLITGPINLSNAGGMVLMVAPQASGPIPVNTYNGRINVAGSTGTNGADGILQVRYSATNTTQQVGLFTNVHLADNASLNIGLAPGAANPRPNIIVDLKMDGATAFLSSNADGGSPAYVRDVSGTNPGSLLTLFGIDGTNVPNINSTSTNTAGGFTFVGAKSINFVGSLNPNITVLNSEAPGAGINLTSNTNITSISNTNVAASFFLNGGTFQTGSYMGSNGTTTLVATTASPGTSGTFLVTAGGTFNVNRSADATITYHGGTLNIAANQTLAGFNLGNGTDPIAYDIPDSVTMVTAVLKIADNASLGVAAATTTGVLKVGNNSAAAPLTITGSGKIDVKSRGMVIDHASAGSGGDAAALASARAQLIAGRGPSGDYTNPTSGITSSAAAGNPLGAVGYALASDVLTFADGSTDTFLGTTVDKSSVLIRYTLAGDLNLDGAVDFLDLARLAQSYNVTDGTRQWSTGDVNFDGKTDFLDLAKMAQNYNTALPSAPIPGAPADFQADLARAFASVPEPSLLSILALTPLLAGRRRRRRT
jgi:autotransporter-associated beta strand protein